MGRAVIAFVTALCFAAACGPSWPHPVAAVDPGLGARTIPISRIDVLPVDLAVWTDGRHGDPADIRLRAETILVNAATEALYQRGYLLGAQVDWNGGYLDVDGTPRAALTPDELLATVAVLSGYGLEVSRRGGLPQPPLPARLGASGAEATLYIGGWSYVGEEPGGGGGKVLKVLAIAAVVVIVVVAIAAIAKSKGKGGGGGMGKLGDAAAGVARVAAVTGRATARALAQVSGNIVIHLGNSYYADPAWDSTVPPPAWDERPAQPRSGRSVMYLEMTLVDNRDGHVLWHVGQRFPASGANEESVLRAARAMLGTLP